MWDRSKMFLRKMGGVILVGSIIIWILSTFPKNITYSTDYIKEIKAVQARYQQETSEMRPEDLNQATAIMKKEIQTIQTDRNRKGFPIPISASSGKRWSLYLHPLVSNGAPAWPF